MTIQIKNRIVNALRQIMGAVVRLALRNGISYLEFTELTKSLFVEISAKEYGIRGRETNDSRIALFTGLDRRDVKRTRKDLNNHLNNDLIKTQPESKMSQILSAWHQDSTYQDKHDQPLEIPLEGESPSFIALVKEYGGDIMPITVLKEFKRSSVVAETKQGQLRVLKRFYIPNYFSDTRKNPELIDPDAISFASSMLVDHINTIFFNLYRDEKSPPKRLELRAINNSITKKKVAEFYRFSDTLSMEYLEKIDQWLTKNEAPEDKPKERVGVGLYYIEGENKTMGDDSET